MGFDNIELVQPEDWAHPASFSGLSAPVFLIHDISGTAFAYHCLSQMNRFVYGIPNPEFWSPEKFVGEFPQMCKMYADSIRRMASKKQFPASINDNGTKDVLLGGWSLGGLLSLHVAKELVNDRIVRVAGILMIDVPYPGVLDNFTTIHSLHASKEIPTINEIALRNYRIETHAINEWAPPKWDGQLEGKRPRTILLRAKETVPGTNPGLIVLDEHRQDRRLGWDKYCPNMWEDVLDIEGNHFNVFANEHASGISKTIQKALDRLDDSF